MYQIKPWEDKPVLINVVVTFPDGREDKYKSAISEDCLSGSFGLIYYGYEMMNDIYF